MVNPLGITVPIQLGSHGYFGTTHDPLVQIRSNLINLLLTRKGERVFQPTFGCEIPRIFFEENTDNNLSEIHAIIDTAVSTWLPFIRIDDVSVQFPTSNDHLAVVGIKYTVLTTNETDTIQVAF